MFARITRYKMKPGTRDEAVKMLESLKEQIMTMPGMIEFINAANEDGAGYVVSINESKELSEANAERVRDIWSNFAPFLEAIPQAEGYDVVAHWMK